MALAGAWVLLALAPLPALAQYRGMPGGQSGGYGGGGLGGGAGIGLGIGGAILGGVVGSMARERASRAEEAEESPPPRRPGRVVEPPTRQRPIVDRPVRLRPTEPPLRVVRPSRVVPVETAKAQPAARPARIAPVAKAPPPRPPKQIVPAAPAPVAAFRSEEPGTVPREVLIELKTGAPGGTLTRLARRERLDPIESDTFSLVPLTLHRYRIRDGRLVAAVVRALQADPQVASAQANHAYALVGDATAALPFAGAQYAVAKLHLDEAHRAATGRGVAIAVIDSGIDGGHPALAGSLAESWDAIGKAALPAGDVDAHGTAVAGIVGARAQLASAAPEARLVALRAFTGRAGDKPGAQGTTIHVLRAIDRAATAGARVVNMSFAGPADAKLSQFLAAGTAKGFVYVAAAGNGGLSSPPLYPAADPNVIAVTATDAEDKLFPGANRGPHLCVSAPGVEVFVVAPGGTYGFLTGTSMAAPQVAGIVAMMLEAKPELTLATLREALTTSARDLGPAGPDADFGAGSADAREALRAIGMSFPAPAVSEVKPTETAKAEPPPVGMAVPAAAGGGGAEK
ncbi:S8 family peptidase [Methylobacterium haplocladii]|nr:S8 family serine peptidase [Methylobacterium haplocladii]